MTPRRPGPYSCSTFVKVFGRDNNNNNNVPVPFAEDDFSSRVSGRASVTEGGTGGDGQLRGRTPGVFGGAAGSLLRIPFGYQGEN